MSDLETKIKDILSPNKITSRLKVDYEISEHKKVVFVSTGIHRHGDFASPLATEAEWLFRKTVEKYIPAQEYQVIPAIRLYDVDEEDLTTEDYNTHREYLMKDLEKIQPDLIIPLGNVALRAVTKQQGVTTKRGCELYIESETTGKVISVIPTLDEMTLYLEPAYQMIINEDIRNAYNKVIMLLNRLKDKNYIICDTVKKAREQIDLCLAAPYVGCDTETTGLDFQTDVMTCFGGCHTKCSGFVIPLRHFESPFTESELSEIYAMIAELHAAPVMKIYANVKFDVKFLIPVGVTVFNNCHDIQFMHSLIDENRSHKLSELSKKYFPLEVETF